MTFTALTPELATRARRAAEQMPQYRILPTTGQDVFEVTAPSGAVYHTTTVACTCPDCQGRGVICKHIFMVREMAALLARQLGKHKAAVAQQAQQIMATDPAVQARIAAARARMADDYPDD